MEAGAQDSSLREVSSRPSVSVSFLTLPKTGFLNLVVSLPAFSKPKPCKTPASVLQQRSSTFQQMRSEFSLVMITKQPSSTVVPIPASVNGTLVHFFVNNRRQIVFNDDVRCTPSPHRYRRRQLEVRLFTHVRFFRWRGSTQCASGRARRHIHSVRSYRSSTSRMHRPRPRTSGWATVSIQLSAKLEQYKSGEWRGPCRSATPYRCSANSRRMLLDARTCTRTRDACRRCRTAIRSRSACAVLGLNFDTRSWSWPHPKKYAPNRDRRIPFLVVSRDNADIDGMPPEWAAMRFGAAVPHRLERRRSPSAIRNATPVSATTAITPHFPFARSRDTLFGYTLDVTSHRRLCDGIVSNRPNPRLSHRGDCRNAAPRSRPRL